jgi:hypothetical protein
MHTDCDIVRNNNYPRFQVDSADSYLSHLTQSFRALTSLYLVITGRLRTEQIDGGFGTAFSRISSRGLRTLAYDTRDMTYIPPRNLDARASIPRTFRKRTLVTLKFDNPAIPTPKCRHLSPLSVFRDLRRFVGPMEAFVKLWKYGEAILYLLPASLESIEIINPTEAFLSGLLEDLADNDGLPNLKVVLVWQRTYNDDEIQKSITISEAVVEWIRRRGVYLGHGLGDMRSEHENRYNGAREEILITCEEHDQEVELGDVRSSS